ncbi:Uncharacterised protein [Mycobacteroides abscessus subsp. abscessus]|nr:Uncharacterised protein [Mycobacteroides abscessus subsp. abscessus]
MVHCSARAESKSSALSFVMPSRYTSSALTLVWKAIEARIAALAAAS